MHNVSPRVSPCIAGLALRLFVVLAPVLLRSLNMQAGLLSASVVDFQTTTQYFMLQASASPGSAQATMACPSCL